MTSTKIASGAQTYTGTCHCKKVRFEATLDLSAGMTRCNCSVCLKTNVGALVAKPDAFRLVEGQDALTRYPNAIGARFFCKHCGVHTHGTGTLAEMGGDFVSVNAQCLDGVEVNEIPVTHWDGRHDNWQAGNRATPWPVLSASA